VSSDLRTRVLTAAAAETSPTRAAVGRRNLVLGFVAVASALAAFVMFAMVAADRHLVGLSGDPTPEQHVERSIWLLATTTGGALAVAGLALWFALRRGGSMLGRPRGSLLFAVVLVPVVLFAWKVGASLAFGAVMIEWPERLGLRCLSLSLLVATGPLVSFFAIRRSAPVQPALNGAVMGLAAGASAWVMTDLWCPVAYVPHVLLGHVLPLLVLSGAGALAGEALLPPAKRR